MRINKYKNSMALIIISISLLGLLRFGTVFRTFEECGLSVLHVGRGGRKRCPELSDPGRSTVPRAHGTISRSQRGVALVG